MENRKFDGMTNNAYENMKQRRDRKKQLLGGVKHDNLNGGQFRQEYINELEQTRKDIQDHNFKLSEGFSEWLTDAYRNQPKERQEERERIKERMFPELKKDPFDEQIREHFKETQVQLRNRIRGSLFPDEETERRRTENESNRHPMDVWMRAQLAEKRRK